MKKLLHSTAEGVQPDLQSMLVAPTKTLNFDTDTTSTAMALRFNTATGEFVGLLQSFVETKTKVKLVLSMDQSKAFEALRLGGLINHVEVAVMPSGSGYKFVWLPSQVKGAPCATVTKLAVTGMQGKLIILAVTLIKV